MNADASTELRLARLQAASGLAFGVFLALHLANSVAAGLGPQAYEGFLGRARAYYRIPAVEVGTVVVAAGVHAGVGVARWRRRRARGGLRAPLWLRLHRLSGWWLLAVFVGHVLATRGPSLWLGMEIGISYLHFSLATWPAVFYPYYLLLFSGGLYHGLQGASAALRALGLRTPYGLGREHPRAALACLLLALGGGVAGILTMGGVSAPIDTSQDARYRALYERFAPFMATWRDGDAPP